MSVLVLDGHSRAAVESVQALGRAGLDVHVAAEVADCPSFYSRYPRCRHIQPVYDPMRFASWLRQLDAKYSFELIIPSTENSLLIFRDLPESDPFRLKAVLPDNRALDISLDKEKTRELALGMGIQVPSTRLIRDLRSAGPPAAFPVVLKPCRSKVLVDGQLMTIGAQIVAREDARLDWLGRWLDYTEVQQQGYIAGNGIGIELLYNHGRKLWHFAHERIHELPLEGGASCYRRSIPAPSEALAAAERLLDALRWHGVAMVEFKRDSRGHFWLLEINPRLWGSLALAIDSGVDFPLGLLMLARQQQTLEQPNYKHFYYTRDLRNDIQWLRSNSRVRHKNSLLRVRPRLLSLLEYLRPLLRRESWDHFDFHDLGVTAWSLQKICSDQAAWLLRWRRKLLFGVTARRHHRRVLSQLGAGPKPARLLFLCHGNICRSPLAGQIAQRSQPQVTVVSAGLAGCNGRSCPDQVIKIAQEFGFNLSCHASRRVTKSEIDTADLILIMDQENFSQIANKFPHALPRTTMLALFSGLRPSIKDPYQSSLSETRSVAQHIFSAVNGLSSWLNGFATQHPANIQQTNAPQPEL
jgi:protein-tyrosine-phosphatase/predicted ATP-grasp superfamily ATP-dependent carboligase